MARAEIIVGCVSRDPTCSSQSGYIVRVPSSTIVYVFFRDQFNADFWYAKSTDGGLTWGDAVLVFGGTVHMFAIWYDKWTPGNTGTLIHTTYIESGGSDVLYRSLDSNGDTLGTQTTVFNGATAVAGAGQGMSLTRAIGGNLLCLFDIDSGTETGFARSVDVGANWTARDNTGGAETADYYHLVPGFAADTQDILCIFWDRSADELSRKIYDDSANTWAESSIAASMVDAANTTCSPQFAVTVDDLNNKIYLVAWTNRDLVNADLRFWTIDESAITEGTNVVLNSVDDQQCCAIALDLTTNDLYVFYGGKSDGSETAGTSIGIYYKVSTDDGATWGAETTLSTTLRNYQYIITSPIFTGTLMALVLADAAVDYVTLNVELPASGGMLVHPSMSGGMRA